MSGVKRTRNPMISPGDRQQTASNRPSAAEAAYPLRDYLRSPSDPLGRSAEIHTITAPDLKRLASVIVASGKFPFKNEQDVTRWALQYGLEELEKRAAKHPEITSIAQCLNAWTGLVALELEFMHYDLTLRAMGDTIDALIERGYLRKAHAMASEVWHTLDRLQDPTWRQTYRKMAREKLNKVAKMMKLADGGEEDRE